MSGRWCGDLGERCKRSQRLHSISRADHAAGLRDPTPNLDRRPSRATTLALSGSRFEGDLFADFYPPQTFALRADATLGNERQMVGRSGRARCKRSQRLQTRSRVRTTLQGCATLPPTWTDARLAPSKGTLARGSKGTFLPISIRRKLLH